MNRRGAWIRAWAAAVFDARTMEHVVDPAIADLQHEPFSWRRYLAVLKVIILCMPQMSVRLGLAFGVSALALVAVVALLAAPELIWAWQQEALDLRMPLYLIPQGLSIGVSIAITLGVLCVCGGAKRSRRVVLVVALLAVTGSMTSFVNAGWLTPAASQAFRVALAVRLPWLRGPFARGVNELTLGEVHRQFEVATSDPNVVESPELHLLAVSYYGRWAITFSPLVFAAFGLVLAGRRPLVRWTVGLGVCVAYLGYLFSLSFPLLVALDRPWLGSAAWYPLIALAILVAAIDSGRFFTRASDAEV